jgi:hypothetical protein
MKHRKLRIAWSVAWGILAVLLIVLWVRSYRIREVYFGEVRSAEKVYEIDSLRGNLQLILLDWEVNIPRIRTDVAGHSTFPVDADPVTEQYAFHYELDRTELRGIFRLIVATPYWFLTSMFVVAASLPWLRQLRWRFTTRTLLIATTLIAIGLGLIVWLR